MQEDVGLGGVFLAHVGGRDAKDSGQIDGKMADGRQSMSCAASANAAVVFAQLGIEDVKAAFDQPAAAKVRQQVRRVGLRASETCDGIGRCGADLAFDRGAAFEADDLLRAGPVEIAGIDDVRRRRDGSRLKAATTLLSRRGGLASGQFLFNCIGGKSLRESRRRVQYRAAAGADCPSR